MLSTHLSPDVKQQINGSLVESTKNSAGSASASASETSSNGSSRRFSFNKRPLSNNKISRKSSQISIINHYPPQQCDKVYHDLDHSKFLQKYKGIMPKKDELTEDLINNLNFEYNYDEKIRNPRMSTVSLFKDQRQKDGLVKFRQTSAPALLKTKSNGSSSANTLDSLAEEDSVNYTSDSKKHSVGGGLVAVGVGARFDSAFGSYHYKPASFDLSKQLRNIDSSNKDTTDYAEEDNNNNNSNSNNDEDQIVGHLNLNLHNAGIGTDEIHFRNNEYQIKTRRKSEMSANSSNISPTRERVLRRESDAVSVKVSNEYQINFKKTLKQIDEPLRLFDNYVPPVLRATDPATIPVQPPLLLQTKSYPENFVLKKIPNTPLHDKTGSSTVAAVAEVTDSPVSASASASASASESAFRLPLPLAPENTDNFNTQKTPTLEHQRSNLSLGDQEARFFLHSKGIEPSHSHWKPNSVRQQCQACGLNFHLMRRRHHCRHCGDIFCASCLTQFANLNLLAHFERPNISHHLSLNFMEPIKSNDTIVSSGSNSTTTELENINNLHAIVSLNFDESGNIIGNNFKNKDQGQYSKFSKVCPTCYLEWGQFLRGGNEYEGHQDRNLDMLVEGSSDRKDSTISNNGLPSDWNWSSF
ncbi:hypothetical protein DAMA08_053860 [Martiniozyma asiatica (nom. inval.)]|nr:hypothetical protein DAMA08_053860 [Martiniozyma asiatica]